MLTNSDVAKVYDTILSIPGMNENVKMDMRLSRKNVLLLSAVIKRGLSAQTDGKPNLLLEEIPLDSVQELEAFADGCLTKAGLTELSEKLRVLGSK